MRGIFLFLLAVTTQFYATENEEFWRDIRRFQNIREVDGNIVIPIPPTGRPEESGERADQQDVATHGWLKKLLRKLWKESSSSDGREQSENSFDEEVEEENEEEQERKEKELEEAIAKMELLQKGMNKNLTKAAAKKVLKKYKEIIKKHSPQLKKKRNDGKESNFNIFTKKFKSFWGDILKRLSPGTNNKRKQEKRENTKDLKNDDDVDDSEESEEEEREGEEEEEWEDNNMDDEENEGEEEEEWKDNNKDEDGEEGPEKESKDKDDKLEDALKDIDECLKKEEFSKASSKMKEVEKNFKPELEKQKKENPKEKSKLDILKEKLATFFQKTDKNKEKKDQTSNESVKDANKKKESEALPWWIWVLISVGILMLLLSPVLLYYECCYNGAQDNYRDESIPDFELNVNVDHSRFRTDGTTFLVEELHQASNDMNQINCMNKEFAMFLKMDDESTQKASISEINLISSIPEKKAGDETKNAISP